MALYLKLQTPTIELKATVKDSSGKSDTITVGVLRYGSEESERKIKKYIELNTIVNKEDSSKSDLIELQEFTMEQIQYIKGITLVLAGENGPTDFHIKDTRQVKPMEDQWETPEECLEIVLKMLLDCSPWKIEFITIIMKALNNIDIEGSQRKN